MPVIARDAVASDHLVYAWPFPIGPEEYEVACAEDELVVMCPAWVVGDRLGPGRHRWRTHDPTRPVAAYFVLTAPVEVSFDVITNFMIPTTGQPVRLRASGSLQVRCLDPVLLVAQFVGLPFDSVNDGVLRSVSRSIERMLARLLTRRVVMQGAPAAVTDPAMLPNIIEELIAYNPTAGAVFGVELVRFGHLQILADDGSRPWQQMTNLDWSGGHQRIAPPHANGEHAHGGPRHPRPDTPSMVETARGVGARPDAATMPPPAGMTPVSTPSASGSAPSIPSLPSLAKPATTPGADGRPAAASGEIEVKPKGDPRGLLAPKKPSGPVGHAPLPKPPDTPPLGTPTPTSTVSSASGATASGTLDPNRVIKSPVPRRAGAIEVPQSTDEITHPGIDIVRGVASGEINPGAKKPAAAAAPAQAITQPQPASDGAAQGEPEGEVLGIGMGAIGMASGNASSSTAPVASGEISKKIAPGGRVLVPGPNGLMQSATVRQLLQGYYELEVGGSGETIWVPMNGVVPE